MPDEINIDIDELLHAHTHNKEQHCADVFSDFTDCKGNKWRVSADFSYLVGASMVYFKRIDDKHFSSEDCRCFHIDKARISSWGRSVLQEMQRLYYERKHENNKRLFILNTSFCESDSSYFRQYSWWTRLNVRLGLA